MSGSARVLVTGGAGFIGTHVVEALLDAGADVTVLDNLDPAAHAIKPDDLPTEEARFVFEDVRDVASVERALRGVDAVIHLAAKVGLGVDLGDLGAYVSNNDVGTAALLEALVGTGFDGPFVLASSMVVYGEGGYRCEEHGTARPPPRAEEDLRAGRFEVPCPDCGDDLVPQSVPESAPVDPRNVYAATKLHQEHLCSVWSRETSNPAFLMRYHNVYGPRMPRDTPYAGVASIFRSALEGGRAPRVFEDGGQLRDFVHVRDVARATVAPILVVAGSPTGARPYNVASGEPHSVGEMALTLADALGGSPELAPVTTGEYRLGDVRHVFASTDRAEAELDVTASVRFAEGMREFAFAPLRPGVPTG